MKKFIKNNIKLIIGVIIGVVLTGSVGVIAYTINARDVEFSPSNENWNVSNVEEAIDYIKENMGINVNNLQTDYLYDYGDQVALRSLNKDLSKGKYIVFLSSTWSWSFSLNSFTEENFTWCNVSCTSGDCLLNKIHNKYYGINPSSKSRGAFNSTALYIVDVTSDTANLKYNLDMGVADRTNPQLMFAYIIKVK